MDHTTEAQIAEAAKAGDQRAFEQLYNNHHGGVYGYLRARLLDAATADDLTQEVFMRAFKMIKRFDTAYRIQPWLLGIGRNVLREHIRRIHRRKEVHWTELCLDLENAMGEEDPWSDVMQYLPACINKLGESARQAIHWHYMGGTRLQDVADRLGRTHGAVKVLMVRARQSLKRCVESQLKKIQT